MIDEYRNEKSELADMYRQFTEPEPACCSVFGCGRRLTMQEQLCGNNCINHQHINKQKINPLVTDVKAA